MVEEESILTHISGRPTQGLLYTEESLNSFLDLREEKLKKGKETISGSRQVFLFFVFILFYMLSSYTTCQKRKLHSKTRNEESELHCNLNRLRCSCVVTIVVADCDGLEGSGLDNW